MATCKPLPFTGITRTRFQAIRARMAVVADVRSKGDSGTADGSGFRAAWSYDEASQTLTIQCTEKPFFITEGFVAGKIREMVESL